MDPKLEPVQPEQLPNKSAAKADDPEVTQDLWRRRGLEDIYFQRENMVNFWTVMGGIAAAALLTQFGTLVGEIQASRWYLVLFFIASLLTIVNSWVQSAWGSLILRWPMTVPGTLIYFSGLFSLCLQSLLVTRPVAWMAASGAVVFFAILNQIYFYRSGAWVVFSPRTIARLRSNLRLYILFLLFTLAGVAHLACFPSHPAELFWGLVSLGSTILALVMQHKGMQAEKVELGIP